MTEHDSVKAEAGAKKPESAMESLDRELLEKLSPQFSELSLDIQEIMKHSSNPMLLSVLLFKLVEERQKSNRVLEQIGDKYDNIMLELKTSQASASIGGEERQFNVLPEQDQLILRLIGERGNATANDVQATLNYKGLNAASQRLNKLYKENYLKKVQSGRKVLFLLR